MNVVGVTPNVYLFTGEQWDADLGMYFLRARYLNPETGRFHTMDTFEGVRTDPQSLHKYLYAHANPVVFIDPSGNITLVELVNSLVTNGFNKSLKIQKTQKIRLVLRESGCYAFEYALDNMIVEAGVYILNVDREGNQKPYVGSSDGQPSKGKRDILNRVRQHVKSKISSLSRVSVLIGVPKGFTKDQTKLLEQLIINEFDITTGTSNKRKAAGPKVMDRLKKAGKIFKLCK